MRILLLIFYLCVILAGIAFAALNANHVVINLYFKTFNLPVSALVVIVLALGVLLGYILFLGKYFRVKCALRHTKSQLKLKEKEIKNLRSIPIQDEHL